eukprot:m.85018 g.85018  ORF g.85018 m.85018 type:complete len:687 (+) comp36424_c0_seq1:4-2064(+)
MEAENGEELSLDEAVAFMCQDGTGSKEETDLALEIIKQFAFEDGLEPKHITSLVNPAGSCKYGPIYSRSLIRCLIPRSTVEQEAALMALSWLAADDTNIKIKALLVKWVIIVFDYLDGDEDLSCIYTVLFNYLRSTELLPYISQLLCYLTKKKDVLAYRVQALLDMYKRGKDQPICALLWVYKRYRPDVLSYSIESSKMLLFKVFEKEFMANVLRVQEKHRNGTPQSLNRLGQQSQAKREKTSSYIPPVSAQLGVRLEKNAIPISEITSIKQLADSIERVQMPAQIASCLKSEFVRHLFAVSSDPSIRVRLTLWLDHALGIFFLAKPNQFDPQAEDVLKSIAGLTQFLQEPLAAVQSVFLPAFLHVWDGQTYVDEIFSLLAYLKPEPVDKFRSGFLDPLEKLFISGDIFFKAKLVRTWRNFLENAVTIEWEDNKDVKGDNLFEMLNSFIGFVDLLCVTGLQTENDHPCLQMATLDFFRKVSLLYSSHGTVLVALPSPALCCRLLFSNCAASASGLCSILAGYRPSLSRLLSTVDPNSSIVPYLNAEADLLNSYIVDMCNALWKNSAFRRRGDVPSSITDVPHEALALLDIPNLQDCLVLYNQIPFFGFLEDFFKEEKGKANTESEGESTSQLKRLSRAQRLVFLDYLRRKGLSGIDEFISQFTTTRKSQSQQFSIQESDSTTASSV